MAVPPESIVTGTPAGDDGSRPGPGLRTRLFAAMLVVAVGVLAVSGALTLLLARRAAQDAALSSLRREAPALAARVDTVVRQLRAEGLGSARRDLRLRAVLRAALEVSRAGVATVTPEGEVVDGLAGLTGSSLVAAPPAALPPGVDPDDLDPAALDAGRQVSGRASGRDVVFVAEPLTATARGRVVLVLSEKVPTNPARSAGGYFLIAAAVALALAAAAAFVVSRFLTRPLGRVDAAAHRIASGDLTARAALSDRRDEIGRLGAAFDQMAARLERSRELDRAFLLSVSHDLRTPLTSIRGFAEGIIDGTVEGDDATRHAAEVVLAEARRLERLVADLLDLARLDAHRFSLAPTACDAAEVVRRTAEGFGPSAAGLGLDLRVDAPVAVPARLDVERTAQLVANLVENALKYATTTVMVTVEAGAGSDSGPAGATGPPAWFSVRVADDGPGVPAAEESRVFERLYQARPAAGRTIGTGLGLAIVRDLATAMGGSVTLATPRAEAGAGARDRDTTGTWTTFLVRLPTSAGSTLNEPAAPR